MRKILIPIALATTVACGFAQAQERERGGATQMQRGDRTATADARRAAGGDRIDTRQARQAGRIRQGVAAGDLTRREASALRSEQRGIRRMEHRARADGVVTPREGRRLGHAQQRASRHINQQRHDRQRRAGRGHDRGKRYAYGRGHDRGKRYAYGRGHDRGNHNAYGRGSNRGNHYAYGRGHNRGHRATYGNRSNHRPQIAARGHFGRR